MARDTAVSENSGSPWVYHNFLALPPEQSALEQASVVLIPVHYDSTTSFRSGARDGPEAIISASYGLEDYDLELELDVSELGIHTTPALEPHMAGPGPMVERVRQAVTTYIESGLQVPGQVAPKTVGLLGGEHSITIGSVQAHADFYPSLSVLYLDAHADLRDEYMNTPLGHASAARRVYEICPLTLVGVRSLCQEEHNFIRANQIPIWHWPPDPVAGLPVSDILASLGSEVYVSVDLDVLDPAEMAAVGTPEPGGMRWDELVSLLRQVGESKRIVGFDVCELAPAEGPAACSYAAAKLVYKLAEYARALPKG